MCHDIVARFGVEKDRQAHIIDLVENVNHHANGTGCSLDEDFVLVNKKHDLGEYGSNCRGRIHPGLNMLQNGVKKT